MRLAAYTLRELRRHRARTLLTVAGVVVGVGALVSVGITVDATRGAYRGLLENAGGRAALEVRADGEQGLDPALVATVAATPGVRAAVGSIHASAAVVTEDGPQPSLVLGIEPERDGAVRTLAIREGAPLRAREDVLLDATFAETHGLHPGDRVRFMAWGGLATFTVAGTVEPGGAASLGGAVTYMHLDAAQRLFGLAGRISSIEVVLEDDRRRVDVAAAVRARLPAGTRVEEPAARAALAHDAILSSEQGLAMSSLLSLIAGAFIVLNTFLLSVGERRRQLALLRALGTTRRQLTWLLLREALLLSGLGTLLGIAFGIGGAYLLKAVTGSLLGLTLPGLTLDPAIFLLALVAGPGVAIAATLVPARRAGATAPLDHLTDRSRDHEERHRVWPIALGFACLLLLAPMELGFVQGWLPGAWIGPGMVALMVGAILVFPLVVAPLSRCAAGLLAPWARESGRIAFRQLARHRVRTSLTAGVFFVAATVAISTGLTLRGSLRDVEQWYDRVLGWDHYVRASMPDLAMFAPVTLPDELGGEIESVAGVDHVARVAFVPARVNERPALVMARTFEPGRPLRIGVEPQAEAAIRKSLARGEVVLGIYLARQLDVSVGDSVTLATATGPATLRVAALSAEYTVGGAALYLEWSHARDLLGIAGPHGFLIQERDGAGGLGARLQGFCAERELLYQSNADLIRVARKMSGGVVGLTWMLLTLVFLVASLGAVNTLTMNVREQTREFGLLRAIAMTRRQLGRVVGTQALALGFLGLIPGVALGIAIGYMMNVAARTLHGQVVAFRLDAPLLIGCAVLTLVVSWLAGYLPARRATRLRIFDALRYE
ncbi:MAG: FtsX-like permease family protein [Planctomycetota bacterium]|jgi:putative ABC transport system permease protein